MCVLPAWAAAAPPPFADSPSESSAPGWLQFDTTLSVNRAALDAAPESLVHRPGDPNAYSLAGAHPRVTLNWSRSGSMQLELPGRSSFTQDNAFRRPQFALVENSDTLKEWLRGTGLVDIRRCQAPVMRMKSTFADSSSRADVSVSARCSFN